MSDLKRLRRILSAWTGNYFGDEEDKQFYDATMILTHQGFQMRAETLAWMLSEEIRKEDYVQDIYAAERELKMDLVQKHSEIIPSLRPKVYEEDGKVIFTILDGKEEIIYAEYPLPDHLAQGTFRPKDQELDLDKGKSAPLDIEIE